MDVAMIGSAFPDAARDWTRPKHGVLATVAVVILACVAAASPTLTAAWELDREAVAAGEVWRIFSGHLTHWNVDHLFWDAATFMALSLTCIARSPRQTAVCVIGSAVAISAVVLVGHPDVAVYRGLSGVDSALFALLAGSVALEAKRDRNPLLQWIAATMLLGFLAKTTYEIVTGATLFVDSDAAGFIPLASSHAAGAAVGLLVTATRRSQMRKDGGR